MFRWGIKHASHDWHFPFPQTFTEDAPQEVDEVGQTDEDEERRRDKIEVVVAIDIDHKFP
ncbi:MAG: hypothetical protein ACE5R6_17965 [Candidatus Heimdallarchaeota archaeon]